MKRVMGVVMALVVLLSGCATGDPLGSGPGKMLQFDLSLYLLDRDTGKEVPAGANYVWSVEVSGETLAYEPLQVSPGKPWGDNKAVKTDKDGQAHYSVLVRDNLGPCIVHWRAKLFIGAGAFASADFNAPPGTRVIGAVDQHEIEVREVGGTLTVSYDIKVS